MSFSYWRKVLSAVICAALILSVFPVIALAEESALEEPLMTEAAAPLLGAEVSLEVVDTAPDVEMDSLPVTDNAAQEQTGDNAVEELQADAETSPEAEIPAEEIFTDDVRSDWTSETYTYVNPYYSDLALTEEEPALDGGEEYVVDEQCYTPEEAAQVVREQMKGRRTSFAFSYITSEFPDYDYVSGLFSEILDLALSHTGNPKEGDYLLWHYRQYQYYYSYVYVNGLCCIVFHCTFTYLTDAAQEASVDKAVYDTLKKLDVSALSDYAKVRAIYDYICENVEYDYSAALNIKYSAYSALLNGKAACQGYTLLLYRLALELGVDCRIIAGRAGGEDHRWNIVKLNGSYYNMDATWDAGEKEYHCLLVSDNHLDDHVRTAYYDSSEFRTSYPVAEEDFSLDAASNTDINWDSVVWSVQDGKLSVSGNGPMPDCADTQQAPWYNQSYTSVAIGNSLTSVGANTFAGSNVAEVTVGESVASIGENAFSACDGLESIFILNPDCDIFDAPGTLGDPDTTVIYCYYNSTAVDYANAHDYRYVILGYANCRIELELTTNNPAPEPTVRVYDASATDLVMYEDIRKTEPSEAEHCVVSVSEETQREDGLYSRTVYLEDVEPGRYNIAAYVSEDYVIRVEYISLDSHADIGQWHMWAYGDVDNNGVIDSRDATQICRIASELSSIQGSSGSRTDEELRLEAADVDRSDVIEYEDAQQILNRIAGSVANK